MTTVKQDSFADHSNQFHQLVDKTLHDIVDKCENLNQPSLNVNEHDGVLELDIENVGTYIINKQDPNQQIWWSSPISGPKRYHYDLKSQCWTNTRDGHFMYDLLSQELSQIFSIDLKMKENEDAADELDGEKKKIS